MSAVVERNDNVNTGVQRTSLKEIYKKLTPAMIKSARKLADEAAEAATKELELENGIHYGRI